MSYHGGFTPMERLVEQLRSMDARLKRLEKPGTWVPVVDADLDLEQGNIWLFQDGRLNVRLADGTVKRIATTTGSGTSGTPKPEPPPAPKTYTSFYEKVWTQTYRGDGAKRLTSDYLHYGNGDDDNGRQTSLIGLPYSTIAADLASSTIKKVEIWVYNANSWWDTGSTIHFGMHNSPTEPATLPLPFRSLVSKADYERGEAKWVSVSTEFGTRLRDGTVNGFMLEAPNDDRTYNGFVAETENSPAMRITYVK